MLANIIGLRALPGFPYLHSQAIGGYIGVTLVALYVSRPYLLVVCKQLFSLDEILDENNEVMSHRVVIGLLGVSSILLLVFTNQECR